FEAKFLQDVTELNDRYLNRDAHAGLSHHEVENLRAELYSGILKDLLASVQPDSGSPRRKIGRPPIPQGSSTLCSVLKSTDEAGTEQVLLDVSWRVPHGARASRSQRRHWHRVMPRP